MNFGPEEPEEEPEVNDNVHEAIARTPSVSRLVNGFEKIEQQRSFTSPNDLNENEGRTYFYGEVTSGTESLRRRGFRGHTNILKLSASLSSPPTGEASSTASTPSPNKPFLAPKPPSLSNLRPVLRHTVRISKLHSDWLTRAHADGRLFITGPLAETKPILHNKKSET